MKHFYTLVLTLLVCSLSAGAVKINVNIDNASAVTGQRQLPNYSYEPYALTEGLNEIEVEAYTSFKVQAKDGYMITNMDGDMEMTLPGSGKEAIIYVYSDYEGKTFNIHTVTESEFRDATLTVKSDNPANTRLRLGGTYTDVAFPEGATEVTVPFSSKFESTLSIWTNNGDRFYKVTKNGEPVDCGSNADIMIEPDMVIDVQCNFPDEDVPVSFTFTNPGTEGAISYLSVAGVEKTPAEYLADGFTVKAGQRLVMRMNSDDYEINSTLVNGHREYIYSEYSSQIVEATVFTIDATAYQQFTKKVIVEGADMADFYRGYSYNNNVLNFNEGENELTLSTKNGGNVISIIPRAGYMIAELTDNGEAVTTDYSGSLSLNPEGVLTVKLAAIVKDKLMVVYFDGLDALRNIENHYFALQNEKREDYSADLHDGYNLVEFYDGDGQWMLSWYNSPVSYTYLNDEVHEGYYGNESTHVFYPEHNDVIKVFLAAEPVTATLSFECEDDVEATATRDYVTPIEDLNNSYTVLPGTLVKLSAPEGKTIKVKVGDEAETESGTHEFTVNADTRVTVKKASTDGVENVSADASAANAAVYNLQGVKVGTKADMKRLPEGIYVTDGKKIHVNHVK